jgi:hypothetical protein
LLLYLDIGPVKKYIPFEFHPTTTSSSCLTSGHAKEYFWVVRTFTSLASTPTSTKIV